MLSRPSITALLTKSIIGYYTRKNYAVNKEIAINRKGTLRADVLAFNRDEIIVLEIKSCKADLQADKKFTKYRKYANKMYLVVPPSMLDWLLDYDLPSNIGIMSVNTKGWMYVVRRCKSKKVSTRRRTEIIYRQAYRGSTYTRKNTNRHNASVLLKVNL